MKTSAVADPSAGVDGRVLPGAVEQKDLAAFNRETLAKYGLPDVQKEDAHVYRDEDGYYVVKEEFHKPTNPFERLKLAKDPMKDTVHPVSYTHLTLPTILRV